MPVVDHPPASVPGSTHTAVSGPLKFLSLLLLVTLGLGSSLVPAGVAAAAAANRPNALATAALETTVPDLGSSAAPARPGSPAVQAADGPTSTDFLAATAVNTYTLRGPMSGRFVNYAFDYQQPNDVWALFSQEQDTTRSGVGLTVSHDRGVNWNVITTPHQYGFAFRRYYVIDPSNSQVRYADNLKTLDGGQNWLKADSGLGGGLDQLIIAVGNPDLLYGRSGSTLWKSTDGGASWNQLTGPQGVVDLLVGDPTNANTIYTASWSDGPCAGGSTSGATSPQCVNKSTDGGKTWIDITPKATTVNGTPYYVTPLDLTAVPGATAQPTVLYVSAMHGLATDSATNSQTPYGGVYRSLTAGTTWTAVNNGLPLTPRPDNKNAVTDYVHIASPIATKGNPIDRNTVYVVASDFKAQITNPNIPLQPASTLYSTKNGGTTWQVVPIPADGPYLFRQVVGLVVRAGTTQASDQVFITYEKRSRSDNVIADFAGGVFRSDDNGATWQHGDNGVSNQSFDWLTYGPDGLYGYKSGVGVIKSTDGGSTWQVFSTYLMTNRIAVNSIIWDQTVNPTAIYIGTSNGSLGVLQSTDGGSTWRPRNLGIGSSNAWMLAAAKTAPSTLFARSGNNLLKSTDNGGSWITLENVWAALSLSIDPNNRSLLYAQSPGAGGETMHLQKSTDGGTTWVDLGENADVFAIDPNTPNRLYRSSSAGDTANDAREGIDVSNDAGKTWSTLSSGDYGAGRRLFGILPTNPTVLLSAIREASGAAYFATRLEYSNDLGETWLSLGDFMPNSLAVGPIVNNTISFYSAGGTWRVGRTIWHTACCGDLDVLLLDGRAGVWGYTFSPVPPPPPPPPVVNFSAATYSVKETDKVFTATVTLDKPAITTSTVDYSTSDGTAKAGVNYSATNGTLTFNPGETTKSFGIPIINDNTPDADKTVTLDLSNPHHLTLGTTNIATLTITDAGPPPSVHFSANTYSVNETAGTVTITVQLSAPTGVQTTVNYSTADGTGIAGQDYNPANGTLTFAPGEASKTFTIAILNDGKVEPNETVNLSLGSPNNASLGTPSTAVLTIVDRTTPPFNGTVFIPLVLKTPPAGTPAPTPVPTPTSAPAVKVSTNVNVTNIPANTGMVRITAKAPTDAQPIVQQVAPSNGGAHATFALPPGVGWVFTAEALGSNAPSAITVQGIDAADTPTVTLAFVPPPAVTCTNPAVSTPQAPPGKILTFTGVSLPAGSTLLTLASGAPTPSFVDGNGLHIAVPLSPGLPAGKNVMWSLVVDGVLVNCALPVVTILPLPHAPGTSIEITREMVGFLNDLSMLGRDDLGNQTVVSSVIGLFRDEIANKSLQPGFYSSDGRNDDLLAQTGFLDQLKALRSQVVGQISPAALRQAALESQASANGQPLAQPAANTYPDAAAVLQQQQYAKHIQGILQSTGYAAVKFFGQASFALVVLALPFGPEAWVAAGAAAAAINALVGMVWNVLEKIFDVVTRVFPVVTSIHATPPSQTTLVAGGSSIPWAGGTIDIHSDPTTLGSREVANIVLQTVLSAGGLLAGASTILGDFEKLVLGLTMEPVNQMANLDWGPRSPEVQNGKLTWGEYAQSAVPLASLSTIKTNPDGVVAPAKGNPGSIQPCGPGSTSVIVGTANELQWVAPASNPPAHTDSFAMKVNFSGAERGPNASDAPMCPGVRAISAGNTHSLEAKSDGTVWAWGSNQYGQLGDSTLTSRSTPVQVLGLTDVVTVAAGLDFSLAIKRDGTLWAWGKNADGQLGLGDKSGFQALPQRVNQLGFVVGVSAGERHALAVSDDGTVYAWGHNGYGQLGLGKPREKVSQNTPQVVSLPPAMAVAAGRTHSLALTKDGRVFAWGYNGFGQLGTFMTDDGAVEDSYVPVQVYHTLNTPVVAIAAGGLHSLALTASGRVYAWGWNKYGQLGFGPTPNKTFPILLTNIANVQAISAGYLHSVAVGPNGVVVTWGNNSSGQLGNNSTYNSSDPVQVTNPIQSGSPVAIDAGAYHTLALYNIGRAFAWGQNSSGQLGNDSYANALTPVLVQ